MNMYFVIPFFNNLTDRVNHTKLILLVKRLIINNPHFVRCMAVTFIVVLFLALIQSSDAGHFGGVWGYALLKDIYK